MSELIVRCDDCGQKNRVPLTMTATQIAKCGRCKLPLDPATYRAEPTSNVVDEEVCDDCGAVIDPIDGCDC